jgi:N6-adenosine-specific RNA methylase IME4
MDDAIKYDVIYADPPWTFSTYSPKGKGRSAEAHYPCMTLAEVAALPVQRWAARNSVLYLWATVPYLANALSIIEAWGFRDVSGFVWVKDRIGTGYWARNRHEHLLIGARGSKVCLRVGWPSTQGSRVSRGSIRRSLIVRLRSSSTTTLMPASWSCSPGSVALVGMLGAMRLGCWTMDQW